MDGLILFSHGSLLCGAGATLREHALRLHSRGGYGAVEVAFLNYSEPPFEEAVARCVVAGCNRIIVVPYFLVPGKFVRYDLPRQVEATQAIYPRVQFLVAEALGYDALLADALLDLAAHARGPELWREDLARAGKYCEADPECPLYGTLRCPRVPALEATPA